MGLPQGAGGSLRYSHSTGTVHGPGSGAETVAAPFQVMAASGASLARQRCSSLDHTEDVLPTSSHSPCCSGGGCSCGGKGLLVGGNQTHQVQVQ